MLMLGFCNSAFSMTMSKTLRHSDPKEDKYTIRKNKRILRAQHRATMAQGRKLERILQLISEGKLSFTYLANGPSNFLSWIIDLEDDALLEELLEKGLDPNEGSPKLLELAERKKTIELLLKYNADPRLCEYSVLVRPLMYYLFRDDKGKRPETKYYDYHKKSKIAEENRKRLVGKAFDVVSLLLDRGANPEVLSNPRLIAYPSEHPLSAIIMAAKKRYTVLNEKMYLLIKRLIWAGSNSMGLEVQEKLEEVKNNLYDWDLALARDSAYYMGSEFKKYHAIRLLLIANRDTNSCFSWLPRELIREIGMLVKRGFKFNYLQPPAPRPVIKPSTVEVPSGNVENVATLNAQENDPSKQSNKDSNAHIKNDLDDSSKIQDFGAADIIKKSPPLLSKRAFWMQKYLPLIGGAACFSVICYAYKKLNQKKSNSQEDQESQPDEDVWVY